jgi:TolB protein
MNADGSNVDLLTPKEHNTIHPNWSADSKQVMYCTNDDLAPPKKNEAQINVVDLATKKITTLITGGINTYGSWSPDMKQIAFRKIIGDGNLEVFLANADGSNQRNLTNNPSWTPTAPTSVSSPTPKAAPPPRAGRPTERRSTSRIAWRKITEPTARSS